MTLSAGIYRDMDSATYFGDPAPSPSLSQSIAKILIERSPCHARLEHPRLRPAVTDDDEAEKYVKAQAIGNAAHKIILGRGKEIDDLDYPDFRTKEARLARDLANNAGRVPILRKHIADATEMVAAALSQLKGHEASNALQDGDGEVALVWQEGDVWFRCLVDWLHRDMLTVDDYKSGGVSVAPYSIGMRMVDQGWDIQAAMIERGLDVLDPKGAGRRTFRFIAQENSAPYALTVCQLSESVMTMGRKKLQAAVNIWRQCIETGDWPAYINRIIVPEYPGFKENQWLEREVNEFSEPIQRGPMLKSLMGG
jgi:PDDEXK-like uncharacterized protein DUF3799